MCAALLLASFSIAGATSTDNKSKSYLVEADLSLSMIALKLYGNGKMASQLAKWNHLNKPYRVHPGQKLILIKPPELTETEGNLLIKNHWLAKMNLTVTPDYTPVEDIKKTEEKAAALEEKKAPPTKAEIEVKFQEVVKKAEEANYQDLSQSELSASKAQDEGERNFKIQKYDDALVLFQQSRMQDEEPLAPWLYEIRTLKLLNRNDEAKTTARVFVKRHPEVAEFPSIKLLLNDSAP